jgi:hypothetical protein
MLKPETMEEQKRVILEDHGATARHVETVRVRKVIGRLAWWDGDVEVYEITGHPTAARCFAWTMKEMGRLKTTAVLEIPPVDSPQTAVSSVIVAALKAAKNQLRECWPDSDATGNSN